MKKFILSIFLLAVLAGCEKQNNPGVDPTPTPTPTITVTDICGNTYKAVIIGTQTWMAENLKCNKYDTESEAYNARWLTNNTVPTTSNVEIYTPYYTDATDKTKWAGSEYGYYSGNLSQEQISKLGYLYNWAAAVGIENGYRGSCGPRQGICPNGWHIPSTYEWDELYDYIHNNQCLSYDAVGKYLKSTSGWYSDYEYQPGTDSYDFAALPAGWASGSMVIYVGSSANFWTSTVQSGRGDYAYAFGLSCRSDETYGGSDNKSYGNSVRCLKN